MVEWVYAWLSDLVSTLFGNYHAVWDTLDIAMVAFLVYWILLLIRGTRAAQMTLGLLVLVLLWLLSNLFELATLRYMLDVVLSWGVLIVIVIFQADIRRALMRVGRGLFQPAPRQEAHAIEEIVRACQSLSQRRVGALIAIERDVALEEYLELGTPIDADLSRNLLISIFLPYSPLHDGAVIVREERVAAAGCILPLALGGHLPGAIGTRHRAAHGIAEETDAIAIAVSEETGKVALVAGRETYDDLEAAELRQALTRLTSNRRRDRGAAQAASAPDLASPRPRPLRIFRNASYKLAAVSIGLISWATAQGFRSVEQSIDVPIVLEQVPADVVVVDQSVDQVNLRVKGSRAALRRVEDEIAHFPISLVGVKPGQARIDINLEAVERELPRGAAIAARSPATVVFRIDARGEKMVPVVVDLVGEPAPGYRLAGVRVTPERVKLEGSRPELGRIRQVMTDRVDVAGARESREQEVRVVLTRNHVWLANGVEPVRVAIQIEAPEGPPPAGVGEP